MGSEQWLTAAEIAALPEVQVNRRTVQGWTGRKGWPSGRIRRGKKSRPAMEYPLSNVREFLVTEGLPNREVSEAMRNIAVRRHNVDDDFLMAV